MRTDQANNYLFVSPKRNYAMIEVFKFGGIFKLKILKNIMTTFSWHILGFLWKALTVQVSNIDLFILLISSRKNTIIIIRDNTEHEYFENLSYTALNTRLNVYCT